MERTTERRRVPSLVWLCLQVLSEFPNQINLPVKFTYAPSLHPSPECCRLVDHLFGSFSSGNDDIEASTEEDDVDLTGIDPRMWATLVQVFDRIPPQLRTYTLPFNNIHLPLLQTIQNSTSFSLITILELPGWKDLTDEMMFNLRSLHTLTALDLSNTSISASGFSILARGLGISRPEDTPRQLQGPWGLRILRLKHCRKVETGIYQILEKFPLLSVVDLRGTQCHPEAIPKDFSFSPSSNRALFTSMMILSLNALQRCTPQVQLFSAQSHYQFYLRIKNIRDYTVEEPSTASPKSKSDNADSETASSNQGNDSSNCFTDMPSAVSVLQDSNTASPDHSISVPYYRTMPPPMATQSKKKRLYSYDADRFRQSNYVPLNHLNQEFDDQLTLYRCPKPWNFLEAELERMKALEISRKESVDILYAPIGADQMKEKTIITSCKLQTMAIAAIQRRQNLSQTERISSRQPPSTKNPFAKRASISVTQPQTLENPITESTKVLRPISTLEVPELPNDLRRGSSNGEQTQLDVSELLFNPAKNIVRNRKMHPERRRDSSSMLRKSDSSIKPANPRQSSQSQRKKTGQEGYKFDWKAWSSKT